MNFTREPLIETVITPKEGYKLVIRNSKGSGQEEFFVDAVEVITFGSVSFFRSLEKPKCFLVPVSDYEILEVRESRMVLKTTGTEKGIKIGGGRESPVKVAKEESPIQEVVETAAITEQRADKRRERRRYRKKRGKDESEEGGQEVFPVEETTFPSGSSETKERRPEKPSLIPPPSTLISETIARYKVLPVSEEPVAEEKRVVIPVPPRVERELEKPEDAEETPF